MNPIAAQKRDGAGPAGVAAVPATDAVKPNPQQAQQATQGAAAATPGAAAGSSLFTTLLVAQIKNQDPLSPTDSAQFVNQLTQLSQVESLHALSSQGSASNRILANLQALSLGGQVGQVAQVQVEQLQLDAAPVQVSFKLGSNAAAASLVLTGADGVEHRSEIGRLAAGEHDYRIDPKALGLLPGGYAVRVENESQQAMPVEVQAEVTGVRLGGDGSAMVQLGALGEFSSQAITQFKGRPPVASKT